MADARLDVGDVGGLARPIDDQEKVIAPVDEHQVVDNGALLREQQPVALLVQAQTGNIDRHQCFQRCGRARPLEPELAHVGHVEEARAFAGMAVFRHQARGVLHRHGIPGVRNHAGVQLQVQRMQRRGGFNLLIGHGFSKAYASKP